MKAAADGTKRCWWAARLPRSRLWRRAAWGLVHTASLAALMGVALAFIVSRRWQPAYGWVEGTFLERAGVRVASLLVRQERLWRDRIKKAPLLLDEEGARRFFVDQIESLRPSHAILLKDGRAQFGWLEPVSGLEAAFRFQQVDVSDPVVLPRERLLWSKRIVHPTVVLAPADVRFLMNYPDLKVYYLPPYLFVTDSSYVRVQDAFEILHELSEEVWSTFGMLTEVDPKDQLHYVCLFRDQESYLRYVIRKEDVDLERSVGCYSQADRCLFAYDNTQSFAKERADRIVTRVAEHSQAALDAASARVLQKVADTERARIVRHLEEELERTLRHEGAHQLADSLGIHSPDMREHLWLMEGFSQYCETRPVGGVVDARLALLRDGMASRGLVPWHELVDRSCRDGFGAHWSAVDMAYAQSWHLFRFLMHPPRKSKFIKYISRVKTLSASERTRPRSEVLADCLEESFVSLVEAAMGALQEEPSSPDRPFPLSPDGWSSGP